MRGARGFTLTELVVAITGMTIIALGAAGLVNTSMQAKASEEQSVDIYRQAYLAMERMTSGVRKCTFLIIPNNHSPSREILAFSGFYNDDDDYYFDNKLFPRIDEDAPADMNNDGEPGIKGVDDDDDGFVDESGGGKEDEDELTLRNEDRLDGEDDDGDGNIDEDTDDDMSDDGEPGWKDIDDDGDGDVDEGSNEDDDEDGSKNEDPLNEVIFQYYSSRKLIVETIPLAGVADTICTNVEQFTVTYYPENAWYFPRIYIALRISGADGEAANFGEWVYPENIVQRTGKRVR